MLDLLVMHTLKNNFIKNKNDNINNNNNTSFLLNYNNNTTKSIIIITIIIYSISIILWIWAVFRAIHCTINNLNARLLHLLFSTISPFWYIVFSYSLDGICSAGSGKS